MEAHTANIILVMIFYLTALIILNILPSNLENHILGVAYIIAASYGVVIVHKGEPLLFIK